MGYSEPASPQQDYSPTATTPVKVPLRPPRSFTPDLSSKRHLSMGTQPSWEEIEDNSMNTSSASIAVSQALCFNNLHFLFSVSLYFSLSLYLSLSLSIIRLPLKLSKKLLINF